MADSGPGRRGNHRDLRPRRVSCSISFKIAGEPVSRVLSRQRYPKGPAWRGRPFLSAARRRAAPATNPGGPARNTPAPDRIRDAPPLFGLAPGGVCLAAAVTGSAVRSCRTLSPLPVPAKGHRRYALCGTFPRLHPAGAELAGRALPATLVSWSPDFPRHCRSSDAATRLPGVIYLAYPVSRSNKSSNRMAATSPSSSPSISSGRQRR